MMKRLLLFALILSVQTAFAQEVEWIISTPFHADGAFARSGTAFDIYEDEIYACGPASEASTIGLSKAGDLILAKYSLDGEMIWSTNMEGMASCHNLLIDESGIFISGSFSDSLFVGDAVLPAPQFQSPFMMMLDFNGEPLWLEDVYTESNIYDLSEATLNDDGNVVIQFTPFGGGDKYMMEVFDDGSRTELFRMDVGSVTSIYHQDDKYFSFGTCLSGEGMIGDSLVTPEFSYQKIVSRQDEDGHTEVVRVLDDITCSYETIVPHPDGGMYLLTFPHPGGEIDGFEYTNPSWVYDLLVIRFAEDGSVMWLRQFSNFEEFLPPNYGDIAHGAGTTAIIRPDGGLWVTGFQRYNMYFGNGHNTITDTNSDSMFLWGVDENGESDFASVATPAPFGHTGTEIFQGESDDVFYIFAYSYDELSFMGETASETDSRGFLVKMNGAANNVAANNNSSLIRHYPDPAGDHLLFDGIEENMMLRVFDISGRMVMDEQLMLSNPRLDLSAFSQGTYVVQLLGEKTVYSESFRVR